MTINAIIYARTSADCAVPAEEQVKVLQVVAVAQGWAVRKVFSDRPMPPKRGREQRPGEVALLSAIRSGRLKRVLLWSLDRVGRSLAELVTILETCRTAGTELYLHDRGIDTGTQQWPCVVRSQRDVGASFAPEPPGSHIAWSGCRTWCEREVWPPSDRDDQSREGAARTGQRPRRERGGANCRHIGGVSKPDQEFDDLPKRTA